jgi:hypothetical protein
VKIEIKGRHIKKFNLRKLLHRHQCFVSIELFGIADAAASLTVAVSLALFGVEEFIFFVWIKLVFVASVRDTVVIAKQQGAWKYLELEASL